MSYMARVMNCKWQWLILWKIYKSFLVIIHLVYSPRYLSEAVDFTMVLRDAMDETSAYYCQVICGSLGNYDATDSNTDFSHRSKQQGQSLKHQQALP